MPQQIFDRGETLDDYGVNAIWIGSGSVTRDLVAKLKIRSKSLKVFAEFNTMHEAGYLKDHPDARPIGSDWTGITAARWLAGRLSDASRLSSRSHGGLPKICSGRTDRRRLARLSSCPRELGAGRAQPARYLFLRSLPSALSARNADRTSERSRLPARASRILESHKPAWVRWRCGVFTDWVREFREIIDRERPGTLLGTFHCPWSESEFDGALREKLAIDLKAQAKYLDVFSIMPYHARFGHSDDPAWISRQTDGAGTISRNQGRARRTAEDLADRAAFRLG